MENQPRPGPARPWLRLASIARPAISPAPARALAPVEPRQPLSQPTLRPTAPPTFPISESAEPATLSSPSPPLPPPPPPLPVMAPVPLSEPQPPPPAFIPGPIPDALPFSPVARVPTSSLLPPSPAVKADVGASSLLSPPAIKPASPAPAAPAPAPAAPAPAPAPGTFLPSTATFSVPPSPKPRVPAPTTPLLRASTAAITAPVRGPISNPTPSPKLIKAPSKTPYQSPKPEPTAPPPSPLALPPSQLKPDQPEPESKFPQKPDQKTILILKSSPEKPAQNTSSVKHHQKADPEISKQDEDREKMKQKKAVEFEKKGMGVITLAGENKGAFMEITMSNKNHENGGHNKRYVYKRGGGHLVAEGNGREEVREDYNKLPFAAFSNSNVQGINNSILFNSSCTNHDPGVHLTLSNTTSGHGNHRKNHYQS